MDSGIDKANKISALISGWGKIIFAVGSLIGACFFFYYQVQNNETNIKALEIKLIDQNLSNNREFEIWGQRSDKRYERAMKTAEAILSSIEADEAWLLSIEKRLSRLEGKLEK